MRGAGQAVAVSPTAARNLRIALVLVAIALATWQRAYAVAALPPDFDERPYLHAAFRYAERMSAGRWAEIADLDENREHPPLVKLAFGAAIEAAGSPEPDWKRLRFGEPLPDAARPAFEVGRWTSAVPGIGQVAVAAAVHPLAGLLLAVEGYHAKYTSQAYLDAIPGLLFALALLPSRCSGPPPPASIPSAPSVCSPWRRSPSSRCRGGRSSGWLSPERRWSPSSRSIHICGRIRWDASATRSGSTSRTGRARM